MKQYELMVIVDPDIGENDATKRLDEVRKLMKDHKAEIFFEEVWGMKDLAYPIKKRERGVYAVFNFTVDPQELSEMERTLRLENEILRHMVITLPKGYEPKSYLNEDEEEKQKEVPAPAPAPVKKAAPKAAPASKPKPAQESKETTKAAKEKEDTSLEEVDAKLKSIIDNPDLNF